MIIGKAKSFFFDEMKTADKCTFFEDSNKNYLKNLGQYRYCLII